MAQRVRSIIVEYEIKHKISYIDDDDAAQPKRKSWLVALSDFVSEKVRKEAIKLVFLVLIFLTLLCAIWLVKDQIRHIDFDIQSRPAHIAGLLILLHLAALFSGICRRLRVAAYSS